MGPAETSIMTMTASQRYGKDGLQRTPVMLTKFSVMSIAHLTRAIYSHPLLDSPSYEFAHMCNTEHARGISDHSNSERQNSLLVNFSAEKHYLLDLR